MAWNGRTCVNDGTIAEVGTLCVIECAIAGHVICIRMQNEMPHHVLLLPQAITSKLNNDTSDKNLYVAIPVFSGTL